MNKAASPDSLFVGWDVGGWDCDRNPNSRDALVIVDDQRRILGRPWRGNLRKAINDSDSTLKWLERIFLLCDAGSPETQYRIILAVDAPLAFSEAFGNLVNRQDLPEYMPVNDSNPYLYRETERFLIGHGHRPLSPVKDMIGSQTTKAMHVLARFASNITRPGVWSDGKGLDVIEAYPSVARKSRYMQKYLSEQAMGVTADGEQRWLSGLDHVDQFDALVCALLAWLFVHEADVLAMPDKKIPQSEGWIWVPKDALGEEHALLIERG